MTPKKSSPEFSSTIGLAAARHDFQLIVFEQAPKIILQHRPLDRNFHRERKGAVAILVIDADIANDALAEMYVAIIGIARIGGDAQILVAEGPAQEILQLLQFGFVQAGAQSIPR